ncbi:hypothetical protein [Erwinia amylovora]
MCIRDSSHHHLKRESPNSRSGFFLYLFPDERGSEDCLLYTSRCVYETALTTILKEKARTHVRAFFYTCSRMREGVKTVSYTHLDVYTRQLSPPS